MRKYFRTKLFGLVLATSVALQAAPLFPDVPEGHWAKDAVAALAAKGLVEGYPDGTFKGDRSASRWDRPLFRIWGKCDIINVRVRDRER